MQRMNEKQVRRGSTYRFNADLLYLNNVSYAAEKVCSEKKKNKRKKKYFEEMCQRNLWCIIGGVFVKTRMLQEYIEERIDQSNA